MPDASKSKSARFNIKNATSDRESVLFLLYTMRDILCSSRFFFPNKPSAYLSVFNECSLKLMSASTNCLLLFVTAMAISSQQFSLSIRKREEIHNNPGLKK